MTDRKTLTGYSEDDIKTAMLKPLSDNAFKKHPTKGYLTTISPDHTRERLTSIFGLFGIGWGLKWQPEHTKIFETQTSKGKPRYHFALLQAEFWFRLGDDTIIFPVTGYSDNDNLGDAMEGARTNCISSASKQLLFQLHIYKNEKPVKLNGHYPEPMDPAEVYQTSERRFRTIDGLLFQLCEDFGCSEAVAKEALKQAGYNSFKVSASAEMYRKGSEILQATQTQAPIAF